MWNESHTHSVGNEQARNVLAPSLMGPVLGLAVTPQRRSRSLDAVPLVTSCSYK
jgi:hypothetical protein